MVGLLKISKFLKFASLFLLFALFSQQALGAGSLVKIYPQEVMLGERVTLVLNGDQALRDFDKINLTELQQQFAIQEIDTSSDQIRLRLYPLLAGLLTIPEIKTGAIYIPRTPITVKANPEVKITWQAPKSESYLGQNLVWKATVELKNSANRASFKERENTGWQTELQSQALIETRNENDALASKTAVFVANYQFLTSELTANNRLQTIQSPAVIVNNTTNRRWLFFDGPQTITIKPLPQFLPMNLTVGQVDFQPSTEGFFKIVGDLNYWIWHIEGKGVDDFALENLAHQLIGEMTHNDQIEWLSESREVSTQLTEKGLTSQLIVRLPYRILKPGLLTLPTLNVRYFDVETAKLVSQVTNRDQLVALPLWLVWVAQWLALIAGLSILYGVLWQTKQAWLNWQLRQAIKKANNTQQLMNAMFHWQTKQREQRAFKQFFKWKANKQQRMAFTQINRPANSVSLMQFQQQYELQFGESERLSQLIETLNRHFYAAKSTNAKDWQAIERLANAWAAEIELW